MIPEVLHKILKAAVQMKASDIHFKAGSPPCYRVDGRLEPINFQALDPDDTAAITLEVISESHVREKLRELQEYDTSYAIPGVSRFRVNVYRQRGSLAIILRVINDNIPNVDTLGLPPVIQKIAENERGMVLLTGATGSGKSSTLAAMIDHINRTRRCHILTIEDPIEFVHPHKKAQVSQREIGVDTPSFGKALRAALRQDPDVILVGEMRDTETIEIALKAAETGHMVFSTVHTTDAAKTINRIVSVFPAEEQQTIRHRLADNLKATISQRLLPRATGKGRVVAAEIMVVTSTVQEYIRDEGRTGGLKDVLEKGRSQYGMQTFDQHLTELYRGGHITLDTASEAATSPSDFQRALSFD